jgi:putative MATE family efflux protein
LSFLTKDKAFYKRLALLALPIIGQDMLNALVNMVDTFMVGSLGETAITAVGLSNQLFFIYILIVFGISNGSAILMGQYYGAKDVKSIRKTLGISVALSILTALVFVYFAVLHSEAVLRIYSKDEAVVREGAKYLKVVGLTYFLCAFTVPVNTALKSMNKPKLPMFNSAVALATSASLNFVFIIVMQMGVAGAAYATLIARTLELVSQLALIKLTKMPLAGRFKDFLAADAAFFKKYIKLTLPVILNEFAWALGTSMYNVAYKHCGTEAQAALQITNTIQNIFWVIGMGIGSASGIILANTLGAGDKDKAIAYSRKMLAVVILVGLCVSCLFLLFSPVIVNIFNVSDAVKAYSQKITYVIAAVLIVKLLNFTTIVGILRSGGDTLFCMILDLTAVWAVGVPLAFLGAYHLGLPVYWVLAMVQAEEVLKLLVAGPRTLKNGWARTLV